MIEIGSFTSEPQYQKPDQKNSDIDFVRYPVGPVVPQPVVPVVPVPGPVPVVSNKYFYDGSFAQRLLNIFGSDVL